MNDPYREQIERELRFTMHRAEDNRLAELYGCPGHELDIKGRCCRYCGTALFYQLGDGGDGTLAIHRDAPIRRVARMIEGDR
jgi:hypothetical protein